MATLWALYQQAPYWAWLGLAGVFIIVALVTGARVFVGPVLAAAVMILLGFVNIQMALLAETALFLAIVLVTYIAPRWLASRRIAHVQGFAEPNRFGAPKKLEMGTVDRASRLVGRVGRTTSAFANGVGRVWIEGAEWAAELEPGEETMPPEAPVRVTRVIGGVRLQVQGLDR
jgi:membrane protein implicated in regulation of membrane protease activity